MDGQSLNITHDLIEQLKAIVPQAFSEDKLDIKRLQTLLGDAVNTEGERYNLSWAGKSEAYKVLQTPTTATLIPKPESSIDWENAQHVFIEGENLEVLKVLQKSYYRKIKMIYIDPPYNTGNDSFIYPDKFSETKEEYLKRIGDKDGEGYMTKQGFFRKNNKENGQFHSNWLNMMLPRLFLSRNLLKEDGIIFIHIDENEAANLTLLLDEIFGEENQIGNITWDKGNPKGDSKGIGYQHESILVYARNKITLLNNNNLVRKKKNAEKIVKKAKELYKKLGKQDIPNGLKVINKEYTLPDEFILKFRKKITIEDINNEFNDWIKKQNLTGGERAYNKIDENGDVYRLVSMAWPNKKKAPLDYFTQLIHPITKKTCSIAQRGWRFPSNSIYELLERGEIIFGKDEKVQPQRKYLLKENMTENLPSVLFYGGSDDDLFREFGFNFENPKPFEFSKSIIEATTNSKTSDIILDFFAGSGTTAHAVMELNEEDSGNRKYICVQLPETIDEDSEEYKAGYKTLADITEARIKKVIKKIDKNREGKIEFEKKLNIGFRKYTLANSNFKIWRGDMIENEEDLKRQMQLFITPQRANSETENILWELLIKNGISLTEKIEVIKTNDKVNIYYTNDKKFAFVLDLFTPSVQSTVLELKPNNLICLDSLFQGRDNEKTNAQLKFEDNNIYFKTI